MTLHARFTLERDAMRLDIDLTAERGETLAIVGPNGAGKTSCLHTIAGLVRIKTGEITVDDEVLDNGTGSNFVPPEERHVGLVFQEHLLFPHLTALDNVMFGMRARGVERSAARAKATEWLTRVGLSECIGQRPATLSGGQAQRVALARALATTPRLLLLDEPLSAVDASTGLELRRDIRTHLDGFDGIRLVVAHSALDAFALADRIAVIEAGRVVQTGTVAEVCSQPRSPYVADLVGLNLFRGAVRAGMLELPGGSKLTVPPTPDGDVLATLHPRAIALYRTRPDGSPRNVWPAPVVSIETAVDRLRVQLGGAVPLVAEVTPAAVADLRLAEGGDVWVAVKASEITVYPA